MSDPGRTVIMDGAAPDDYVRLSDHPRARRSIARSKAIGGVAGFVLGFWFASRAGLPAWDSGVRALVGGIAGYVLIWLGAVQIWRQIAIAEYRGAVRRRAEYRRLARERAQEQAAAVRAARDGVS
jgi:hypothetical protein